MNIMDQFNEPSFDGFRVIAGPSQQVSQSWINGRSTFEKVYSYYLVPNQRNLTYHQAGYWPIQWTGCKAIKINVTAAVEQPRDPNSTVFLQTIICI
jgi:hypothetical protein